MLHTCLRALSASCLGVALLAVPAAVHAQPAAPASGKKVLVLTHAALLTYVIPMSFLAIPFYSIMGKYGLTNNPIAVIAVEVTFATPYAIFIFQQYGASIPMELDEAARIGSQTLGVLGHREQGDTAVGFRRDDAHVGDMAVEDEAFLAVEAEAVARARRRRR